MKKLSVRFDKNSVAVFSKVDGSKLRFAIGNYTKASRPELVDIKITDWCDVGCIFCYQNSTLSGKHASALNIALVIHELSSAKVFEVALGGGETTAHPEFVKILRDFKEAGIVPNFTTKKPAVVRKLWPEIKDLVGGFAYSAETAAQIYSAAKMMKEIPKEKVSLHYVMGLGDRNHFEEYLKAANDVGYRVTLLGYKTSGRGKDLIPFPYSWWIDSVKNLVKENSCPNLSIDTPLAAQYDGLMPINKRFYHIREGAFSMYIDNVSMEMGASSFEDKKELIPFTRNWKKDYKRI